MVERFERKEKILIDEDQTNMFFPAINEAREKVHNEEQIKASLTPTMVLERRERIPFNEDRNHLPPVPKTIPETDKSPNVLVKFSLSFTEVLVLASEHLQCSFQFDRKNYVCYMDVYAL